MKYEWWKDKALEAAGLVGEAQCIIKELLSDNAGKEDFERARKWVDKISEER